MSDSKNLLLAIGLSTLVLLIWQVFYTIPKVDVVKKQQAVIAQERAKKEAELNPPKPESINREEAIKEGGRIRIKTASLHGSISLKGARIDDLTLANFHVEVDPKSPEVMLLSPSGTANVYFSEFGWLSTKNDVIVPNSDTIWYSDSTELTPTKPIILTWDNNNGLKFVINIAIDNNYMFEIKKTIINYGKTTASILPYGLVNRTKDISKSQNTYVLHEGMLGVFNNILAEERYKDLISDKKQTTPDVSGWLGITDKYWLTAIIPDQTSTFDANYTYYLSDNQSRYQSDYLGKKLDINPGQNITEKLHFFAGAKKVKMLDKYAQDLGIPLFDRAVDFGRLYFITKPLFKALVYFNDLLGNFGLAILLLTIIIKLLLFPLASKSFVSMHKLKQFQPRIAELRERFKDNKIQLQKEIMELYKREKVNPLSGCLPLLIQIPIFYSLYKVLYVTIEMRHAPFFGWIHDLSAQDPTSIFNLFGLLPFQTPAFFPIGAWPCIMGLTMFLQQKMNPPPADPTQATMMKWLPLFFLFLFYKFPAGLVIYWAWNNLLSITQQWIINKRLESK